MFIGWSRMDHKNINKLGGYTQYKNIFFQKQVYL